MITYAITDRSLAPAGDLILQASGLIRAGIGWIQIREKDLSDRTLYAALRMLVPEARRFGARLLVNGRPDLAAAAGASGVHLPSDGLPTERVRRMFPAPFLVLRSCHSESEVLDAAAAGADAVTLGPVFETPSKAAYRLPHGAGAFRPHLQELPHSGSGPGRHRRLEDLLRDWTRAQRAWPPSACSVPCATPRRSCPGSWAPSIDGASLPVLSKTRQYF